MGGAGGAAEDLSKAAMLRTWRKRRAGWGRGWVVGCGRVTCPCARVGGAARCFAGGSADAVSARTFAGDSAEAAGAAPSFSRRARAIATASMLAGGLHSAPLVRQTGYSRGALSRHRYCLPIPASWGWGRAVLRGWSADAVVLRGVSRVIPRTPLRPRLGPRFSRSLAQLAETSSQRVPNALRGVSPLRPRPRSRGWHRALRGRDGAGPDWTGLDGTGRDETGLDWMGLEGLGGLCGTGRDGTGRAWTERDETGRDEAARDGT